MKLLYSLQEQQVQDFLEKKHAKLKREEIYFWSIAFEIVKNYNRFRRKNTATVSGLRAV